MIAHSEGWVIYSDGTRDDFNDDYPNDIDYYYWTYMFDDKGTCGRKAILTMQKMMSIQTILPTLLMENTYFERVKRRISKCVRNVNTSLALFFMKKERKDGEKFEYTYTHKKI